MYSIHIRVCTDNTHKSVLQPARSSILHPSFLNIGLFKDFTTDYIRMYTHILECRFTHFARM